MRSIFKKAALIIFILLSIIIVLAVYRLWPTGLPEDELYFKPVGERQILPDERGQWNFVLRHYNHLDITGDEFKGWDTNQQLWWRYGIAFASYGMPSLAIISPQESQTALYTMKVMIKKMKSRKVWGDFIDYGMGDDPVTKGNIMYKGHLNLMYGLYQFTSGDTTFAREYTWLTEKIVAEMREHHRAGTHEGADCEPGRYFAQCNAIGLLSLHIYDKIYGTNFTDNEVRWTLEFLREKMTDPQSGLYYRQYNSEGHFCDPYLSGYGNGWTLAFLKYFEPERHEQLYQTWKKTFVEEWGPFATVKEDPRGGRNPVAHMCGLLAAKAFGDVELFGKLRNAIDDQLAYWNEAHHEMKYRQICNEIQNGPILWTKLHLGWKTILEHDWGVKHSGKIPDTAGMVWTDVLPQELHLRSSTL